MSSSGTVKMSAWSAMFGSQPAVGTMGHSWSAIATSERRTTREVAPSLPVSIGVTGANTYGGGSGGSTTAGPE
jgi:hypothetical protein